MCCFKCFKNCSMLRLVWNSTLHMGHSFGKLGSGGVGCGGVPYIRGVYSSAEALAPPEFATFKTNLRDRLLDCFADRGRSTFFGWSPGGATVDVTSSTTGACGCASSAAVRSWCSVSSRLFCVGLPQLC